MEEEIVYFQEVWDLINKEVNNDLKSSVKKAKSNLEAATLNVKAYDFMLAGNIAKAEFYFKRALLVAEYNGSVFGNILYNLSALRILQHDHQNCIELLDQCVNTIYGQNNFVDVCVRKIVAYAFLGNTSLKEYTFDKLSLLVKCNNWSLDLLKEAEKALTNIRDKDSIERENLLLPPITRNLKVTNVCENVEIKYSEKFGRQIVAKNLIKKGEVILVDKPFSCQSLDYCTNCFEKCYIIVPCKYCCFCVYCSEKCREDDISFHDLECPLFQSKILSTLDIKTVLAFRLFLRGVQTGLKAWIMSQRATTYGNIGNMFPHIQTLYPGYNKIVPPLMKYAAVNSAILTAYIKTNKTLTTSIKSKQPNISNVEFTHTIGAHLMRLIIVVHYNSYIIGSNVDDTTVMLYPCYSLLNHSCCPNTIKYLSGSEIVLKASENIEPGKQIFTSYGLATHISSREKRKMYLRKYYNFNCTCKLCTIPSDKSLREIIKCTKCIGYASLEQGTLICYGCRNSIDIEVETLAQLKKIYQLVKEYQDNRRIENLYEAHTIAEAIKLNPKHSLIAICYYQLSQYEIGLGKMKKGFKYISSFEIDHTNFSHFIEIIVLLEKRVKRLYVSTKFPFHIKIGRKIISKVLHFLNKMKEIVNLYHPKTSLLDKISRLEKYFTILKCIGEFEASTSWTPQITEG